MNARNPLVLYLPVAAVVTAAMIAVGYGLVRSDIAKLENSQVAQVAIAGEIVASTLQWPISNLRGLLREPHTKRALLLSPGEAAPIIEEQLTTLLYRNEFYDKARWLDRLGDELVCIRQGGNGPIVVPRNERSNKSDTPWFRDMAAQPPGGIYLSALEISSEGESAFDPDKSVIRLGILLDEGRDSGIFAVNFHAQHLLERLEAIIRLVPGESIHLLNPQGYWLLAPKREDAFGFALGVPEKSFAKRQPAEWARISAEPAGQMLAASGLWTWNTIDPAGIFEDKVAAAEKWKFVTHIPAATITQIKWSRWLPLLVLGATSITIAIYGLHQYRKLWLKRQEERLLAKQIKLRQQEIIANERKYLADVIEGSDTGTWEWNVQTGETVFNEVWANLIGYRLEELQPVSIETWMKFAHPDDLARSNALLERCFRRETEIYECEARMRHRNGEWIWVLDRGRVVEWTEDGKPLRMLGTHRDITDNMKLRQELERQATTDALTGLCNRRQFLALANRELSRTARQASPVSLLMMDIDKFKSINDTRGHAAGDAVLKSLARTCAPHLREIDVFARIGGEEFAVILPATNLEGASLVAERIREAVSRDNVPAGDGPPISVTVSLGAVEHADDSEDIHALLKRADDALYRAKNRGRNRVCTG